MKINELRIGNYVLIPDHEKKVYYERTIVCIGDNCFSEDYKPITLTEDWLFKFGFEETTKEDYIDGLYIRRGIRDFGFSINKETMCYCDIDYEGTISDNIQIKYVHQLQNIYFALTEIELTIEKL